MVKHSIALTLLAAAGLLAPQAASAQATDDNAWDRARAALRAQGPTNMAYTIDRWKTLSASNRFGFADYSGFVASYPGLPDEEKLRRYAEEALSREYVEPSRLAGFFDRFPPLTNPGRAQYALALAALRRPEAETVARSAWRGGPMSDAAEAALFSQFYARFNLDDQDARMDALLWAGSQVQAERQLGFVSPQRRAIDGARLAAMAGNAANPIASTGETANYLTDPGYVFQRARLLRKSGSTSAARALLVNRPPLARPAADAEKWVEEMLVNAKGAASDGDPRTAVRIAQTIDQAFAPGTDVSATGLGLRDDYTSLVWLGGTEALWDLRDPSAASPLFFKYGAAAKTPQTRSKGFYWAGLAASQARDTASAQRYFEMAAQYPDFFYGQLALERLGRPIPSFPAAPGAVPTQAERIAFNAAPLTAAVREVARESDWRTAIRFFREISDRAETPDRDRRRRGRLRGHRRGRGGAPRRVRPLWRRPPMVAVGERSRPRGRGVDRPGGGGFGRGGANAGVRGDRRPAPRVRARAQLPRDDGRASAAGLPDQCRRAGLGGQASAAADAARPAGGVRGAVGAGGIDRR